MGILDKIFKREEDNYVEMLFEVLRHKDLYPTAWDSVLFFIDYLDNDYAYEMLNNQRKLKPYNKKIKYGDYLIQHFEKQGMTPDDMLDYFKDQFTIDGKNGQNMAYNILLDVFDYEDLRGELDRKGKIDSMGRIKESYDKGRFITVEDVYYGMQDNATDEDIARFQKEVQTVKKLLKIEDENSLVIYVDDGYYIPENFMTSDKMSRVNSMLYNADGIDVVSMPINDVTYLYFKTDADADRYLSMADLVVSGEVEEFGDTVEAIEEGLKSDNTRELCADIMSMLGSIETSIVYIDRAVDTEDDNKVSVAIEDEKEEIEKNLEQLKSLLNSLLN